MNELGSDYFFSKSELIIPKNKKVIAFLSETIFEKSGNFRFWYLNVENRQNPFKDQIWTDISPIFLVLILEILKINFQ